MATHDLSGLDAQITAWEARLAESVAAHRSALSARRDRLAQQLVLAEALQLGELRAEGEALLARLDEALRLVAGPPGHGEAPELPFQPVDEVEPGVPIAEIESPSFEPTAIAEPEPQPTPEPEPQRVPEPEPEQDVGPEPKPEIPLPPKRVPTAEQQKAFRQAVKDTFNLEAEWHAMPEGKPRSLIARSLICLVRGLREDAPFLGQDVSALDRTFEDARNEIGDRPFFGLSPTRNHSATTWQDLAKAYRYLAQVEEVLSSNWVKDLAEPERGDLIDRLAAANAYLARLSVDQGLGFADEDQNRQKKTLEKWNGKSRFIRWWQFLAGAPPLADLVRAADELRPMAAKLAKKQESQLERANARAELEALVEQIEAEETPDDWVDLFRAQVVRCLEAGMRPTDPKLRKLLLPYRAYLGDLPAAQGNALVKALDQYEMKLVAQKKLVSDAEDPAEPDPMELKAVKEYLAGKRLLLVGGQSQPARIRKLKKTLGVDVDWPGSDKDDRAEMFRAHVDAADVVCLLIRFSRHAYADALKWAREQGKDTVTLKAGMGVNRLVNDIYTQVIARRKPDADAV